MVLYVTAEVGSTGGSVCGAESHARRQSGGRCGPGARSDSLGIPAITMSVNWPTLPPALAAACVVATLLGLAVALLPGQWAAERPLDLIWLATDGLGLMPALMLLHAVELPGRGVSLSPVVAWFFAIGGLVAGAPGWPA